MPGHGEGTLASAGPLSLWQKLLTLLEPHRLSTVQLLPLGSSAYLWYPLRLAATSASGQEEEGAEHGVSLSEVGLNPLDTHTYFF